MKTHFAVVACLSTFLVSVVAAPEIRADEKAEVAARVKVAQGDWPWWRGPTRDGQADPDQDVPLRWSDEQGIRWQTPVPGRGHGAITVVGNRVFLTVADHLQDRQAVVCLDRSTGRQIWSTVVHQGGLSTKGNKKASQASTTVACDGSSLFVNFLNRDAVFTTALSLDGKQLWQTKISDYVVHQGYGSSPAIYGPLVLVSADNKGGGAIAGLDRKSGKIVWKHSRPSTPNYPSPIILKAADTVQVVFTGCDLVSSHDPLTGRKLWEIPGATTECVTSTVTDGLHVYSSGGYPRNHVAAIRADGSGQVVWEKNVRVYVPSMLVRDRHLYAVTDAGVAMCWNSATGQEQWKLRLGGTFTASPVMVGDRIYVTNEAGRTYVYRATPEEPQILATNDLGDEVYATPTICGGHIYMRVASFDDGQRSETVYCIGR